MTWADDLRGSWAGFADSIEFGGDGPGLRALKLQDEEADRKRKAKADKAKARERQAKIDEFKQAGLGWLFD